MYIAIVDTYKKRSYVLKKPVTVTDRGTVYTVYYTEQGSAIRFGCDPVFVSTFHWGSCYFTSMVEKAFLIFSSVLI